MAEHKYYIGSLGPFYYDDTDNIDDPDGDFIGETQGGFVTTGPIRTSNPPTDSEDVVRKGDLIDALWPIGSVYFSVNATDPSTTLGGTWTQIGAGKFIVGQDSGDTDYDTGEETGGAATHTHTVDPASTTSTSPSATTAVDNNADGTTVNVGSDSHTHDTNIASTTSSSGSNIPPYLVLYIWKRTA